MARGVRLACPRSGELLVLEIAATGEPGEAMFTDIRRSVYIRLPRGRGESTRAYIYASRGETVNRVKWILIHSILHHLNTNFYGIYDASFTKSILNVC